MNTAPTETPKDTKRVTMPARYTFTDAEVIELAKRGVSLARQHEALEKDFSSIKADYKLRLTNLENERARLDEKIADNFEMRATECEVEFNAPVKGHKTTRRVDNGEVVSTDAMSPLDRERDLPLEEPKQPIAVLPDEPSDVLAVDAATITPSEPISTNVGDALSQAAAAVPMPQVLIPQWDEEDWGPKSIKTAFKKAAALAGWPVAAINTLMETVRGNNDVPAVKRTLAPHVKGAKIEAVEAPVAPPLDTPFDDAPVPATTGGQFRDPLAGELKDGHIQTTFGMLEVLTVVMPSEDLTTVQFAEDLRCKLNNAAVVANWPETARKELNGQAAMMDHRELVELTQRLTGVTTESEVAK